MILRMLNANPCVQDNAWQADRVPVRIRRPCGFMSLKLSIMAARARHVCRDMNDMRAGVIGGPELTVRLVGRRGRRPRRSVWTQARTEEADTEQAIA